MYKMMSAPEREEIIKSVKHYGKHEGMKLAMEYLPESSPFTDVAVVSSIEQWEQMKGSYPEEVVCRVDAPIGRASELLRLNTSGMSSEIPQILRRVQALCADAVVLVTHTKRPPVNRLHYDGGFNISFNYGKDVLIEMAGPGFDGHELTYGLAVHEAWNVPWDGIMDMKRWRGQAGYSHRIVDQATYTKQREARFILLTGECGMDECEVAKYLPEAYEPKFGRILLDPLMNKIVVPLMEAATPQIMQDWGSFSVQGNIVDAKPEAWEIFLPKRWS